MVSSARRLVDRASLEAALLPRGMLALALEPELRVVVLELPEPEATLRALGSWSLLAAEALPRAVPKRRAEFAAGRYAASLALAEFGCSLVVGRAVDGSPVWPPGFTGSISHGAGLAVAVGARVTDYQGLGLDVEALISEATCQEIAPRIMNAGEFEVIQRALPRRPRSELLSLGFSAKESLYKCLNPLAREFIEFDAARVVRVVADGASHGRCWLSLCQPFGHEFPLGFELEGRYAFASQRIETAVWLPSRSQN